ncbi:MAG: tetratricopeptide repeat protein [Myxococcota bacterium]
MPRWQQFFFGLGLAVWIGVWGLGLTTAWQSDQRLPALWVDEGRDVAAASERGDWGEASERSRIRWVLHGRADALLQESNDLAVRARDPELGVAALRHVLALRPYAHGARLQLAGALSQQGRREEAIAELRWILAVDPNHPGARRMLAGFRRGRG